MSSNRAWILAAFLSLAIASLASAKRQKKSTASSPEKPEAILAAAKKASETRGWRVDARIEANKQMNISGIVAVNDFDLTIETVNGTKATNHFGRQKLGQRRRRQNLEERRRKRAIAI